MNISELEKEKTVMFIGHSTIKDDLEMRMQIKLGIIKLIKKGANIFLNGGMGKFDLICADCVNELKEEYPNISHYLIIPYAHFNWCDRTIFDGVINPGLEKFGVSAAIPERNKWMITQS